MLLKELITIRFLLFACCDITVSRFVSFLKTMTSCLIHLVLESYLTTVGKVSAESKYTELNEMEMKNFAMIPKHALDML